MQLVKRCGLIANQCPLFEHHYNRTVAVFRDGFAKRKAAAALGEAMTVVAGDAQVLKSRYS